MSYFLHYIFLHCTVVHYYLCTIEYGIDAVFEGLLGLQRLKNDSSASIVTVTSLWQIVLILLPFSYHAVCNRYSLDQLWDTSVVAPK